MCVCICECVCVCVCVCGIHLCSLRPVRGAGQLPVPETVTAAILMTTGPRAAGASLQCDREHRGDGWKGGSRHGDDKSLEGGGMMFSPG